MCHLIQSSPNETGAILICILSGKTEAQWNLTWPMSHNWKAAVFHREFQSTSFPSPHFSSLHHIVMPYNLELIQFIIHTLVNHTSSLSHGADIFIGGGRLKWLEITSFGEDPHFGGCCLSESDYFQICLLSPIIDILTKENSFFLR